MDELRIPGDPQATHEPHDVLAADEFAMPSRGDFGLHLPRDPHGIQEPHDVLAADEFGFPAGPDRGLRALTGGDGSKPGLVLAAAAVAVLLYAVIRRR